MAGEGSDPDLVWNLLGLVGLLGLLRLRKEHPDDSYHPAPLE
jgi:MYXO-CTERM domain-containing protein